MRKNNRIILHDDRSGGDYDKIVSLMYSQQSHGLFGTEKMEFEIFVGEKVDAVNGAYAEITSPDFGISRYYSNNFYRMIFVSFQKQM